MLESGSKKPKPFTILVFAPYESQVKELWNTFTQLIGDSPLLKDQVKKIRTSDVHTIEFYGQGNNPGSIIKGYTIGISSSNQGTSLRGLSGDMIFIDEMDFIPSDIIKQVILPITTTHPDVKRRICSTPSGKRELYFKWCTEAEEMGWLHLHFPSWHPDNDNWLSIEKAKEVGRNITDSTEFQVKKVTDSAAYAREYGGEFGEEFGGVYKHHLIASSMIKYGRNIDISDPDIFDPGFEQHPEHKYIIGVDWNSYINGGQIVMLEFCSTPTSVEYYDDDLEKDVFIDFTGKYRLFYRRGIRSKESTQRFTRQEIIRLMTYYKVDYLYVDYGAGDTNIEELSLYGKTHPELGLNKKLKVIDSGATVDHYDHVLQKHVKKRNKSLMVNFSVISLEEGMFVLPKEEDVNTRLIGQMREYKVKHVTARGEFAYEGEDHILDAFNLAVYGFQQNYGSLLTSRLTYNIGMCPDPRASMYPIRSNSTSSPIKSTGYGNSYNMPIRDPDKPTSRQKPQRVGIPRIGSRTAGFSMGGSLGGRSIF
jgi:replicative DNA helicase